MRKQAKIVYDGQSYWLLWHWEELIRSTPLAHGTRYVSGPYISLEEINREADDATHNHGWLINPFGSGL